MAALLLRLFNDSEVNKVGSLLIFTTHNIELMKSENMRSDQSWCTEKKNGVSDVYCVGELGKEKV
ncbi:ATP-binding protein, partial [Klebsiella pneumoniae]|nr:ATP-binding protein [Klebsiella pneumoniae]